MSSPRITKPIVILPNLPAHRSSPERANRDPDSRRRWTQNRVYVYNYNATVNQGVYVFILMATAFYTRAGVADFIYCVIYKVWVSIRL